MSITPERMRLLDTFANTEAQHAVDVQAANWLPEELAYFRLRFSFYLSERGAGRRADEEFFGL